MTNTTARTFKGRVQNILLSEGYPDYAVALNGFAKVSPAKKGVIGCTNGSNIYLDSSLTDEELSVVARHEILHVLLNHFKRAEKAGVTNHNAWNIAADYELSNYYSAADDAVMLASEVLRDGCSVTFDNGEDYRDKTAEEIYADEMQKQEQNQNQQGNGGGNGSPIDDIFNGGEGEQGSVDDDLREKIIDAIKDGRTKMTDEEKEQTADSPLNDIAGDDEGDKEEKQTGSKDGDTGRSAVGVGTSCKAPKAVKGDLHLLYSLQSYFRKASGIDKGRSFRRPNKKYGDSGIIMRSRTNIRREKRTLAVYVDVSGSMSQEQIARGLGVCEKIEGMKNVEVIKKYFDTKIHDSFVCGGGTDYDVIIKDAQKNGYKSIAIITDDSPQEMTVHYTLDALWLIGITEEHNYRMAETVNQDGGFKTRQFQFDNVPPIRD